MSKLDSKIIENKKEWESFLDNHGEANFLHSWLWGEFHERLGKKVIRTGIFENEKIIGVLLSIVERSKRGKFLIVPGGPIVDWQNKKLATFAFYEIKKIAKENNCIFARVRPQLISDDFSKNIFKEYGFRNAPTHLHAELTTQLDITKSEEEIIANMRKATRYEIKKAQRIGIKVEKSKDPKLIKKFYEIQLETARRQKFVPFSYNFLHEQFKVFSESNNALLFNAYFENKLLAQAFVIFYGNEAVYHYGTGTDLGRKYPGAYLIQWEAILESKKRNIGRYNFWGVAPENKTNHRFSGISIFKRGFGGKDVEYLHAQDLIINYPMYAFDFAVEFLRNKIRRL